MQLELVAHSRAVFFPAFTKLVFLVPAAARKGDVLVAMVVSDATEPGFVTPTGWNLIYDVGATSGRLTLLARVVDDNEPTFIDLALTGVTKERHGQMLVLRGGGLPTILEASATAAFASGASIAAPASSTIQAVNLLLAVWSCDDATVLAANAAMVTVDTYNTGDVTQRSSLVAYKVANKTGAITPPAASAAPAAAGRAFTLVLRAGPPITPLVLEDVVPGNVGLLGKDTRPPR